MAPPPPWFLLSTFLICCTPVFFHPAFSTQSALYSHHCASTVPESTPADPTFRSTLPRFTTSYFSGGHKLLGTDGRDNRTYYYGGGKSLTLRIRPRCHETIAKDTYKIEGSLTVVSPRRYYDDDFPLGTGNVSFAGGSYYRRRRVRNSIRFSLSGFWSEVSRKLCMVGSAASHTEAGEILTLHAVLKIKYYASENQTIASGTVSGSLQSTSPAANSEYFDPISVFDFPALSNYSYSLVSKEIGSLRDLGVPRGKFLRLGADKFCNVLGWRPFFLEMDYATECNRKVQNCSPLGATNDILPQFLSLSPIQCSNDGRRIRYMATFQNYSYSAQSFSLESTLIAEAAWDDKTEQLFIAACRISSPLEHFEAAVSDCTIRLRLRYPSSWTIRNGSLIIGQLMSMRPDNESDYFKRIRISSSDSSYVMDIPGQHYEYTEMERFGKLCHPDKLKKKGNEYPDGNSYDMKFDMTVKTLKGQQFGSGYAMPLFVGNESYRGGSTSIEVSAWAPSSSSLSDAGYAEVLPEPEISAVAGVVNISYKISIDPYFFKDLSKLYRTDNWLLNRGNQLEIMAEGVYNAETGQLCMVGCRKLQKNSSATPMDCEILVKFDFAPLNARRDSRINGSITSTRRKEDPFYFGDMILSSTAYYIETAAESVWRMDMEITLVLISNTLFCVFLGLQIFHAKRNPEVASCISLIMVLILCIGHMIPLVLNIEAVFLENHNKQTVFLSSGGWLEANEVAVRVITMIAFLLQIRLLQLVWTAKKKSESTDKSQWIGEKKAAFLAVPVYASGALLTFLLNWMRNGYGKEAIGYQKYSLWGDFRSYAGLILDAFLLPQIVLNAARGSTENALSHPFYVGTSAVRLVPHAYNQYRMHSYPASYVNGTYYYANPTADFYSTSWDVIIPLGVIAMAVVIFLQQRRGGRCILPQRFRELELYAKVPTVDNE